MLRGDSLTGVSSSACVLSRGCSVGKRVLPLSWLIQYNHRAFEFLSFEKVRSELDIGKHVSSRIILLGSDHGDANLYFKRQEGSLPSAADERLKCFL